MLSGIAARVAVHLHHRVGTLAACTSNHQHRHVGIAF